MPLIRLLSTNAQLKKAFCSIWRGRREFWGVVALYRAVARLSNVIKQKEG